VHGRLCLALVVTALALAASGCGGQREGFCGLVLTVNGFDPVEAVDGIACATARSTVVDIERDDRGAWDCSRAMHAAYELACRDGHRELQVLENVPVTPRRQGDVVTLANWSFRIAGRRLEGRSGSGAWIVIARPPICITDAPRTVLVALRLPPLGRGDVCFRA
jgi:hypothetical protein